MKHVEVNLFIIYYSQKDNLYIYTVAVQPKAIENDLINNEKSWKNKNKIFIS